MSSNWNPGHYPGDSYGGYSSDPYGGGYSGPSGGYGSPYGGGYGSPSGGYPGYGPPGGYPPPPGFHTHPPPNSGSAIGALIMSIILMLTCCGIFSIVGIIFSSLAIGEKQDHEKHARYTRNAWISNWVNLGILALFAVGIAVAIALDA